MSRRQHRRSRLKRLRESPDDARQDAGYQIDKVQRGEQRDDFKPMASIGQGVEEIRIWDEAGTFRVIYTGRIVDTVTCCMRFSRRRQRRANLRARAELMRQIAAIVRESGWTQAGAAGQCDVTQPRMNDLLRGRVSRYSIDALVNIATATATATAIGRTVHFDLQAA